MVNQIWRRGKLRDLYEVCPYCKSKIQSLIKSRKWREGLEFVTDEAGDRLYNLTLIQDWMANMNDPEAYQRACEAYLQSLPSNWPQSKTPKSSRQAA